MTVLDIAVIGNGIHRMSGLALTVPEIAILRVINVKQCILMMDTQLWGDIQMQGERNGKSVGGDGRLDG